MKTPLLASAVLLFLLPSLHAARAERESTCVTCHADEEDDDLRAPVEEWQKSIHAEREVSCDGCHGGDPRKADADVSMSEKAGFLEAPAWKDVADHCGVCHEALAESYHDGGLGEAMRSGERTATCVDCHMPDGHQIREAGPLQLDFAERCPRCLPLVDAESSRAALRDNREAIRGLFFQLEEVERKGMEVRDLHAELSELYRAHGVALHRFEPGGIEEAGAVMRPTLEALAARTSALGTEADRRRRYGALVLVPMAALVLGLFLLPRRPPSEEK